MPTKYRKGELLTGEMKKECIDMMTQYVKKFQEARAKVTDEVLEEFLRPRQLEWRGNPRVEKKKVEEKTEGETAPAGADGQPLTKNQQKKLAKLAEQEKKKAEKAAAAAAKS